MGRRAIDDLLEELVWLAGACSANILVVGDLTASQREHVTTVVAMQRQSEVFVADSFERLPAGTGVLVVLDDASRLADDEQQRLLRWIDGAQPQILSFARGPLYPLVRSGRLLEALFYRLNVLSFIVEEGTVREAATTERVIGE